MNTTLQTVQAILDEHLGSASPGADEKLRRDLLADSLDLVEIACRLEEAFDIEIDDAEITGDPTVGDVVSLIESKLRHD